MQGEKALFDQYAERLKGTETFLKQSSRIQISLFGPTVRCHWQDTTPLHDQCEVGNESDFLSEVRPAPIFRRHHRVEDNIDALQKAQKRVYIPNMIGQLPLHVAARTNRITEGQDGTMDNKSQPAPQLVAMLLTGKHYGTGEKLFNVRKDKTGKDVSCLHQDALGMTPLHAACRSDCSEAKQVVASLLEANPDAARIVDCDGMLPLDYAVTTLAIMPESLFCHECTHAFSQMLSGAESRLMCITRDDTIFDSQSALAQVRSPHPAAADLVKMLLRVYPCATVVFQEDQSSVEDDWRVVEGAVRVGVGPDAGGYSDQVLRSWFNGNDASSTDLRFNHPWTILVQHMIGKIDAKYHEGNISVPKTLVTLEQAELRFRLLRDKSVRSNLAVGGMSYQKTIIGRLRRFSSQFVEGSPLDRTASRRSSSSTDEKGGLNKFIARAASKFVLAEKSSARSFSALRSSDSYLDGTVTSTAGGKKMRSLKINFHQTMDSLIRTRLSNEVCTSQSMRILLKDIFDKFDSDSSGKISIQELEEGLVALNTPFDSDTLRELLLVADGDGDEELDLQEFEVLMAKMINLPEIFCQVALRNRWDANSLYRRDGGMFRYITEESSTVHVNEVTRCVFNSCMQDPTVLNSRLPYRANDIFHMIENKNQKTDHETPPSIGKKLYQSLGQWQLSAPELSYDKVGQRMDSVHDQVGHLQGLPLHWACSNHDNKQAAMIVRDILRTYQRGAAITDFRGR